MSSISTLQIDLAGVARLAGVRRPVASMWRTRFATSSDPFPPAVAARGGRPLFDAGTVAQWLVRTKHGNNPDAIADAAALAAPADFDITDTSHVAAVDALLTLQAISGEDVGGVAPDELQRRAASADPHDEYLAMEVSRSPGSWAEWADSLADAAYSPGQASQLIERRHASTMSSAGIAGPLEAGAEGLLVSLAGALAVDRRAELDFATGMTPALAAALVTQAGDDVDVTVRSSAEARGIRRRLLCEGLALPGSHSETDGPRLLIARLPSSETITTHDVLDAIDELVLGMQEHDRAIVVAPAAMLVGPISSGDALVRTSILRSGRVRAIVKLPAGLVVTAPRAALALWVLGRETGEVPIADRFTAVADLTDSALSPASRSDLTNDVLAAMGSARDVRAHAFRFTRLMRTTSLLAAGGALISDAVSTAGTRRTARDLPALLDRARLDLGEDAPHPAPVAVSAGASQPARVDNLIARRHLRVVSGTRLAPDELTTSGLVVVGIDELERPTGVGMRRVDQMTFALRHPSARLTVAGDVVFRTAPTPKAWVDHDGSKVVEYPARVLRIDRADPGGLVPELVAADIVKSPGGPAAWRRWMLHRVAPDAARPLRAALSDLAARREALIHRIQALDSYADLLSTGVVAGSISIPDPEAALAAELQ